MAHATPLSPALPALLAGVSARAVIAVVLGICSITVFDLGSHSTVVPKWVGVHLAALLALFDFALGLRRDRAAVDDIDLLTLAFVAYAALSLAWSSDPGLGSISLLHMTALAVVFTWVRRRPAAELDFILPALFVGAIAVALVLAAVLPPFRFAGFGNRNYATELMLVALPFPLALMFHARPVLKAAGAVLGLGAIVYLLAFNQSKIEFLVIPGVGLFALGVFLFHRLDPFRFWALVTALIAAPAAASWLWWEKMYFATSLAFRLELWTNSILLWLEAPFLGHGLGSFDFEYPRLQESHLSVFPWLETPLFQAIQTMPGAAHNDLLQGLAEFGVAGVAIAVLWLGLAIRNQRAKRGKSLADHAAALSAAALLIAAQLEFPLQNPATALAAALVFGALAVRQPTGSARVVVALPAWARWLPLAGAALGVPALGYADARLFMGQKYFLESASFAMAGYGEVALERNLRAYEWNPYDRKTRQQLFIMVMALAELKRELPYDTERMEELYRVSASAAPDWAALALARLAYLMGTDSGPEPTTAIEEHLRRAHATIAHQPTLHYLEASYRIRHQDWAKARAAIAKGRAVVGLNDWQRQLFGNLERLVPADASPAR
ncbi:MAG: O-antigen ligase family protein [Pseudomonadota bacterium]